MTSDLAAAVLTVAGVFFVGACDEAEVADVVDCAGDADCAANAENTVCNDIGVCVAPGAPVCAADSDCDVQDTGEGSPITAPPCDEASFEFAAFDGNSYCGVVDDAGSCAAGGFATAEVTSAISGGTGTICVVADGTCGDDGQCS